MQAKSNDSMYKWDNGLCNERLVAVDDSMTMAIQQMCVLVLGSVSACICGLMRVLVCECECVCQRVYLNLLTACSPNS